MSPELEAALEQYCARMQGYGLECTREMGLYDFWNKGLHNDETHTAFHAEQLKQLNDLNGVIESPDALRGWHIVDATLHKPGVYRLMRTRTIRGGYECANGFCRQDILRVAIEQNLCTKPNGYTLP